MSIAIQVIKFISSGDAVKTMRFYGRFPYNRRLGLGQPHSFLYFHFPTNSYLLVSFTSPFSLSYLLHLFLAVSSLPIQPEYSHFVSRPEVIGGY